ncbi:MAG: alpha/beta fold hydrolase [Clostridia bacterium]|jgi:alpha/beta superfamily hydrolase|nr:alpha/beta fold hydrolase [Clostridia bacterium]MDH7572907.1 alpha/beta fold hydrolase [Clostridia bacterium]
MPDTLVRFKAGELELEGLLACPPEARAGVVICHPHPLHGANMRNFVVRAVAKSLQARGFATFRFNFRGVGNSEGEYDEGRGEVNDALEALAYLGARLAPGTPLGLCGYSFGGMVAFRAAAAGARIAALAGIAPYLVMDPPEVLAGYSGPKFIVVGTADDVVDPRRLKTLVDSTMRGSREFRLLDGADHFFVDREAEVGEVVAEFFTTCLPG